MGDNRRGAGKRARVSIPAEVLVAGRRRSFAWVKDISRKGARLRCGARIPAEAPVDLVLHPHRRPPIELQAIALSVEMNADARSFDVRVRFVDTPKAQLDMLVLILGAVRSGGAPAAIDHAVVIISKDTESRHQLAEVAAALDRRPVLVSNPLDAIQWLQDARSHVDAIIASEHNPDLNELIAYVHDTHPTVRRLISVERTNSPLLREKRMPLVEAVVSLPVQRETLRKALLRK